MANEHLDAFCRKYLIAVDRKYDRYDVSTGYGNGRFGSMLGKSTITAEMTEEAFYDLVRLEMDAVQLHRDYILRRDNPAVKAAYEQYRTLLALVK